MRTRILPVSLVFLALGIMLLYGSSALAQGTDDSVQVVRLSDTGLEQAHSVAFSANGKSLAVGTTSGVYLLDPSGFSPARLIHTGSWAHSVAFVPGTDAIAAGLFDDTVKVWTGSDHQLLRTLDGPQGWVRSISFSKDGGLLAAASDDNTIHVWDVAQGSVLLTLSQNIVGIRAVALSPDGRLVAAALGDVTVRLWDMSNGQLLRTLSGHTSSILGLAFSPDGTTLASGSTDTTIHLWRVEDGAPLQVLRGHTGFVYSVAFSPDGKTLASGASDDTVRLWKVDAWLNQPAPQPANGPVESTTKDCRLCHHRRGNAAPARVVEVPCEACHAGGIGLSWCAAFPRSTKVGPLDTTYHAVDEASGVPTGDSSLAVLLASPANGETLYVRGDHMAPEVLTGRVSAADSRALETVELQLQIVADGQPTQTLITAPAANGTFEFKTAINALSPPPQLLKPSTRQCLQCHGDYQPDANLPVGIVHLVVTATTPNGQRATDERWIRVDSSRDASVPVQVVDAQTGQRVPGVAVDAHTTFYQWRDRFGTATSGGDGTALLALDDSSQVTVTYHISVPSQVVNGVLYSSETVPVQLNPGVAQASPVVIRASAQRGAVNGSLQGSSLSSGAIGVWAIQWPAGPAFQTSPSQQDSFSFPDLPIGSYIITPDLAQLAGRAVSAAPQRVDLTQSPHTTVALPIAVARSLTGTVTDVNGQPVPFAWVQVNGAGSARPVEAASGQFVIPDLPNDTSFITVDAAGFYSQSLHVPAGQKTLSLGLVPDPAARRVSWGQGQIIIPPQTNAEVVGARITLTSGWLWGTGRDGQPLTIDVGSTEITLSSGEFALERAASQPAWLYLRQGQADVLFSRKPSPVRVHAGQMIALIPSAEPLAMDKTVALSLHPPLAEPPVSEQVQPTVGARLQNSLEKAGISTLQTITFITYFLSLAALITIAVFVLFSINKRRKATPQEKL